MCNLTESSVFENLSCETPLFPNKTAYLHYFIYSGKFILNGASPQMQLSCELRNQRKIDEVAARLGGRSL